MTLLWKAFGRHCVFYARARRTSSQRVRVSLSACRTAIYRVAFLRRSYERSLVCFYCVLLFGHGVVGYGEAPVGSAIRLILSSTASHDVITHHIRTVSQFLAGEAQFAANAQTKGQLRKIDEPERADYSAITIYNALPSALLKLLANRTI